MKYVKIAGIVWAAIYFIVGAVQSFTINSNDTWATLTLLFGVYLLPLPITIMAVWFPKVGARALAGCVAINLVALSAVLVDAQVSSHLDKRYFVVFVALYNIPHLLFIWSYLRANRPRYTQAGRVAGGP